MPTLSVVIPNFNHGAFLPEVVASCLTGDACADEVLVVDDASTDDSRKVLARLAESDSRVRMIALPSNGGPAAALNAGIAATRGDWLLLRAADDICPAGSLAAFRRVAAQFPSAGLIVGDLVYFSANPARGVREPLGRSSTPVEVDACSYLGRYGANIIHGAASFVRRDWVLEAGGLDETLRWHCDWFLLLQLGLTRGFVYAPEVFGAMRLNSRSYNAAGTAVRETQIKVLTRLVERLEANPDLLGRILACGCLDFFGEPLQELLRSGDNARRQRFAALLGRPSTALTEARSATGLAAVFRSFLTRHRPRICQHPSGTALFGAGGHTRQLLAVWRELGLPQPRLVLDNSGSGTAAELDGIPVRSPACAAKLGVQLVILSSKSYEQVLAATMDELAPDIPYLKIWGADES